MPNDEKEYHMNIIPTNRPGNYCHLHLIGKSFTQRFIPLDTGRHRWTLVDTSEQKLTQMDTNGHKWTQVDQVDTLGHKWTLVDTSGHKWTQLDAGGR